MTLQICKFIETDSRCFLVNIANLFRTPFLQNKAGWVLPIITVSIAVRGQLGNKPYIMTQKLTHANLSQKYKLSKRADLTRVFEEGVQNKNRCDCTHKYQIKLKKLRSSDPEVFCKKGVLRNFAKFTGKHLCQRLFLNKVIYKKVNFIKKETLTRVFSCEFCETFPRTLFFIEHLWSNGRNSCLFIILNFLVS